MLPVLTSTVLTRRTSTRFSLVLRRSHAQADHQSQQHGRRPTGYSYAVKKSGTPVFISGQVGIGGDGRSPETAASSAQTEQVFQNLRTVVEACGGSMDDIVKITVFVTDPAFRSAVVAARQRHFTQGDYPASHLSRRLRSRRAAAPRRDRSGGHDRLIASDRRCAGRCRTRRSPPQHGAAGAAALRRAQSIRRASAYLQRAPTAGSRRSTQRRIVMVQATSSSSWLAVLTLSVELAGATGFSNRPRRGRCGDSSGWALGFFRFGGLEVVGLTGRSTPGLLRRGRPGVCARHRRRSPT